MARQSCKHAIIKKYRFRGARNCWYRLSGTNVQAVYLVFDTTLLTNPVLREGRCTKTVRPAAAGLAAVPDWNNFSSDIMYSRGKGRYRLGQRFCLFFSMTGWFKLVFYRSAPVECLQLWRGKNRLCSTKVHGQIADINPKFQVLILILSVSVVLL